MSEGVRSDERGLGDVQAAGILDVASPAWEPVHLPFRPRLRTADEAFAHPFEAAFARLLTAHRVRWSYEPTSFPIRWDDAHRPVAFVTPDFYLPDHRLYVELTTVRQRLVTRKHRKIRLLRDLYPNIKIKILYRRDYQRLILTGEATRTGNDGEPGRLVLDREAIVARLGELALQIARDLGGPGADSPLLLACGPGGRRVLADLTPPLRAAGLVFDTDAIRVRHVEGTGAGPGGVVTIRRGPLHDPAGRRVLIIHGIVSSGLTAAHAVRWLWRQGARDVSTLACLDRRCARLVDVELHYAGFDVPADLLVGYGLDARRTFRDAPFVATFRPFDRPGAELTPELDPSSRPD